MVIGGLGMWGGEVERVRGWGELRGGSGERRGGDGVEGVEKERGGGERGGRNDVGWHRHLSAKHVATSLCCPDKCRWAQPKRFFHGGERYLPPVLRLQYPGRATIVHVSLLAGDALSERLSVPP